MKRLMEKTVFSGLTAACRRASWPTSRSPVLVKATTDGVVRPPSAFGMTTGSPASMTAITEFVVPRSMPTVFAIFFDSLSICGPGARRAGGKLRRIYPRVFGAKRIQRVRFSLPYVGRVSLGANADGDRGLRASRLQPGPAAE